MKKILLCLISVCMLAGCASTKEPQANVIAEPEETESTEEYALEDKDLPDFDYIPINFQNKAYIVSVDGKFGMMDIDGNWVKETDYGSLMSMLGADNEITYCAVPTGEQTMDGFSFNSIYDGGREKCTNTGFGGPLVPYIGMKEENGEYVPYYIDAMENKTEPVTEETWKTVSPDGNALKVPLVKDDGTIDSSKVFVGTVDGDIYGPYDSSFEATISDHTMDYDATFQHFYSVGYRLYGHFVIPEAQGYRIYNNRGDKSFDEIADGYTFITKDTILYGIGARMGILDEDCNVLIETSDFENISVPMDGKFFGKKDGKWYVVSYED